jgi:hypothetical protein
MTSRDWAATIDLVERILHVIFAQCPREFVAQCARRGITMAQLASATITQAVYERIEQASRYDGFPENEGHDSGRGPQFRTRRPARAAR